MSYVYNSVYARIRGLLPWESQNCSHLRIESNTIQQYVKPAWTSYTFKKIFKPQSTNEECFKTIVIPMISNVIKGFNSILITYGQTGSGKTFSIIGQPNLNIIGILPQMLQYIIRQKTVEKVELSAIEAFGVSTNKIMLFDLYDKQNQINDWSLKKGCIRLDMNKINKIEINDHQTITNLQYVVYGFIRKNITLSNDIPLDIINICVSFCDINDIFLYDITEKISYAHSASHVAPIGNNIQSSRGHKAFIAKIYQNINNHETQISYFLMMDCAGSNNIASFTQEFKDQTTPEILLCRRLETGTINVGLSQLYIMLNELRRRGKLHRNAGYGLRNLLHPFINAKTSISLLFTISPSIDNAKATRFTLRFAVNIGLIKAKPIIYGSKWTYECKKLVSQMKQIIEIQEEQMHMNSTKISTIQRLKNKINLALKQAQTTNESLHDTADSTTESVMSRKIVKAQVEIVNDNGDVVFIEQAEEKLCFDEQKADAIMKTYDGQTKELLNEIWSEFQCIYATQFKLQPLAVKLNIRMNDGIHAVLAGVNDEEFVKASLEKYSKITIPWRKEWFTKKLEREIQKRMHRENIVNTQSEQQILIDAAIEPFISDYERLKQRHKELILLGNELNEHAMELQVLLAMEECVTNGLIKSKEIMIDYLRDDGREALIAFFRVKGII